MQRAGQTIGLVVILAICFGAAALGSSATASHLDDWYAALAKPSWTPPAWVFGPMWTVLYVCMAVAAWLVWRQRGIVDARVPLALFLVQLAFNAVWSWLFFGLHNAGLAFVDIVLLLAAIVVTMVAFWRRSVLAASLLVPYLAWVAFAGVLNFAIWRMNL
ncbi:MAG TPA: TspO/MBR family protein [Thermoguttaceae bacterium]|nr:TspO/MBR family protein [Thermoguttaceae bacterium]